MNLHYYIVWQCSATLDIFKYMLPGQESFQVQTPLSICHIWSIPVNYDKPFGLLPLTRRTKNYENNEATLTILSPMPHCNPRPFKNTDNSLTCHSHGSHATFRVLSKQALRIRESTANVFHVSWRGLPQLSSNDFTLIVGFSHQWVKSLIISNNKNI